MGTLLLNALDDAVRWWFSLPGWLWILLLFAAALLVGYLIEKVIMASARKWAKRTRWTFDDDLVEALHPSLSVIFFVGLVWLGLHYLPIRFAPITVLVIDRASVTIAVLAGALAVARVVRVLLHAGARKEERWQPLAVTGSRVSAIIIYVVSFLVIINQYGIEITPILTTLGLAGLAVALALQDTLANVFSGIWIQTQRSMQPGHYVRLEDSKLEGFVDEIGWRTTKIRTLPGNLVVVPNQTVARTTITDFSLPASKMGTSITVVAGFESDPEQIVPMLLEECLAAADEVSYVLTDPPPSARLNRSVENGWEFWMGFWVPAYYNQWNAQGYVLNRIRRRFLREGVRIPYPLREIHEVPADRPDFGGGVAAPPAGPPSGDASAPRVAVAEVYRGDGGPPRIRGTK